MTQERTQQTSIPYTLRYKNRRQVHMYIRVVQKMKTGYYILHGRLRSV